MCAVQATRVAWLPPAGPGYVAAERLLAVAGWAQDEADGSGCHVVRLLSLAVAPSAAALDGSGPPPPAPAPTPLKTWRHAGAVTDLHVRCARAATRRNTQGLSAERARAAPPSAGGACAWRLRRGGAAGRLLRRHAEPHPPAAPPRSGGGKHGARRGAPSRGLRARPPLTWHMGRRCLMMTAAARARRGPRRGAARLLRWTLQRGRAPWRRPPWGARWRSWTWRSRATRCAPARGAKPSDPG